jgi:hypothetical protein
MRPPLRIGNVMPEQDLVGGIARLGLLADEAELVILVDFSDESVCRKERSHDDRSGMRAPLLT